MLLHDGQFVVDAAYQQQGDDLLIVGPNGDAILVQDYFLLDPPPAIETLDGGWFTPALIQSFTVPETPGQYAQAGTAPSATSIGLVQVLSGSVFARRADGTQVSLRTGDPIFQGDVVETGPDSTLNLIFIDETTFTLGSEARLAIDELVYNPATASGTTTLSILKGAFVFVSGEIAHHDYTQMKIGTPVATIGIRGTTVAGIVKAPGERSQFTVIDGEITVATRVASVTLNDAFETTYVESFNSAPGEPFILNAEQIELDYGQVKEASGGFYDGGALEEIAPEAGEDVTQSGSIDTFAREFSVTFTDFSVSQARLDFLERFKGFFPDNPGSQTSLVAKDTVAEITELITSGNNGGNDEEVEPPEGTNGNDILEGLDDVSNTLDGGDGDDIITGGNLGDTLTGGSGNDIVFGGGGNDLLIGGSGNGDDSYDGGAGVDTIQYTSAVNAITVNLKLGFADGVDIDSDILSTIEHVTAGEGDDTITGADGDETLEGRGGKDTLIGGAGDDTLIGDGDGTDLEVDTADYSGAIGPIAIDFTAGGIVGGVSAGIVSGGEDVGTDVIIGIERIIGTDADDSFVVGDGFVSDFTDYVEFEGRGGDDQITGNGATRISYRGAGEGVSVDLGVGIATGGTLVGTDSFTDVNQVVGSTHDDTLIGSNGSDDTLLGGDGADILDGRNGVDLVDYSEVNVDTGSGVVVDLSTGQASNDGFGKIDTLIGIESVSGSDLDDKLTGDGDNNRLAGAAGDDILTGAAGNDTLEGGDGADTLDGGTGNDTLIGGVSGGGSAIDTVDYSAATGAIVVNLTAAGFIGDFSAGTVQGNASVGTDIVSGIERIVGTSFNDFFTVGGNVVSDFTDYVEFEGGAGNDFIIGSGETRISYRSATSGVTVDLAAGNAFGNASVGTDTFFFVNQVSGSAHGDALFGSNFSNDTLQGGAGNDFLDGRGGTDTADYWDSTAGVVVDLSANTTFNDGFGNTDTLIGIESVRGSQNDDTLTGNFGNNRLVGGGGDDALNGGSGADTLEGDAGQDALLGGDGNDVLLGGEGDDTLSGGSGSDQLRGEAGADLLQGGDGNDFLIGGAGDDTLDGGSGNDRQEGGSGNDTFLGDAGSDSLIGGSGTDVFDASAATQSLIINLQAGSAFGFETGFDSLSSIEHAIAGAGNDSVTGSDQSDTLEGGAGNDQIDGGAAADVISGGDGDDVLVGGTGGDTLQGGAGEDAIAGQNGADVIDGGADSDTASGGIGNDTFIEQDGSGDDIYDGGTDDDGLDVDTLDYTAVTGAIAVDLSAGTATGAGIGSDTIAGFEKVLGGADADVITGDDGANTLAGGGGNDTLIGGLGDDVFAVGDDLGDDSFVGGDGIDTADFSNAGETVNADLGAGTITTASFGTDRLDGVERVIGGRADDTLFGGAGNDTLEGGSGADILSGGAGDDILIGGADDDTLTGGAGIDGIGGGDGFDTLDYSAETGTLTINLSSGIASGDGIDADVIAEIERVLGGSGADGVTGSENDDVIETGAGDDVVAAGAGQDTILGGAGVDFLNGNGGDDFLDGGTENDLLFGGAGGDTLLGGDGNDSLTGDGGADTLDGGVGADALKGGDGDDLFIERDGSGNDNYDGEDGNDTIDYTVVTSQITVNLTTSSASGAGIGTNILTSIETVLGGTANDAITGSSGADTLSGGEGDDTLRGIGGDDRFLAWLDAGDDDIDGGDGVDTLDFSKATEAVTIDAVAGTATALGLGTDTISNLEHFVGGTGDDTIIGADADETLRGGAGDDFLSGGVGNDELIGGDGIDAADYSGAVETVVADLVVGTVIGLDFGTDTLTGIEHVITGAGDDTLIGSDADEILESGGGLDIVTAAGGNDRVVVAVDEAVDSYAGGAGIDLLDFTALTTDLVADLATQTAAFTVGTVAAGDDFIGFEGIIGGSGNDTIAGTAGDDTLIGGLGNDTLNGIGGSDRIEGGGGDDLMIAGSFIRDGVFDGGAGLDTLDLSELTESIVVNFEQGTIFEVGTKARLAKEIVDIEGVISGSGDDTIFGSAGSNTIDGGGGIDTVSAGGGNDRIVFDVNDAELDGGSGIDTLAASGAGQNLDAAQLANTSAVEIVDLSGTGSNTFTATEGLVSSISDTGTVTVIGDGDDIARTLGDWTVTGTLNDLVAPNTADLRVETEILVNDGTIGFADGAVLDIGSFSNNETLQAVDAGGTVIAEVVNNAGGTIALDADTASAALTVDGNLINNGLLSMLDGAAVSTLTVQNGTLSNAAIVSVEGDAALIADGIANAGGEINFVDADASIVSGTLDNTGGMLSIVDSSVAIDTDILNGAGGQILLNAGTATATLAVSGTLENNAAIDVESSGAVANLNLDNGLLRNAAMLSFDGDAQLTGDTVVNLSGGEIDIVSGTLTSSLDGLLANEGLITVAAGATFEVSSDESLPVTMTNTGALTVNGAARFVNSVLEHSGQLTLGAGAVVTIGEDASIDFQTDFTLLADRILNVGDGVSGSIAGTATVTNQGSMILDNGTLGVDVINEGSLSTENNVYQINDTLTLKAAGSIDLAGSKTLQGPGTVFNQDDVTFENDTIDLTFIHQQGDLNFAGVTTLSGELRLEGPDVVEVGAGASITGNGTLDNSGDLSVLGGTLDTGLLLNRDTLSFAGSAGTVSSDAVTNFAGATIASSVDVTFDLAAGQTLDNQGLIDVNAGTFTFRDGIFAQDSVLDIAAGAAVSIASGGLNNTGDIDLAGVLEFAGGVSTNTGNLNFAAGTLALSGSGVFNQNVDLTLDAASQIQLGGGTLDGTGLLTIEGAVEFNNGGVLAMTAVNEGALTTENFQYDVAGVLTTQGSGSIELSGANLLAGGGTYAFAKNVDLTGDTIAASTTVSVASGFALTVSDTTVDGELIAENGSSVTFADALTGGGSFQHETTGSVLTKLIDVASLTNTGDLALNGGELASANATNSGTIEVVADSLIDASGAFNNSGTIAVQAGTTLTFGDGTNDGLLSNSGTIELAGVLEMAGGTANNTGILDITTGGLLLSGGVFNQEVDLTLDSAAQVELNGGTLSVAGATLTLEVADALTGTGQARFSGDLDVASAVAFTPTTQELVFDGGNLVGDGTLVNQSTVRFEADGDIAIAEFRNGAAGTLDAFAGTISVTAATFVNEGLISVTDTLRFESDVANTGTLALADGGEAVIGSAFTFGGGAIAVTSGSAALTLDGGTLALQTDLALDGGLSLNAVGTVSNALSLDTFTFTNNGVVEIAADAELAVDAAAGGTFINQGTVAIGDGGSVTATGTSIENNGGIVEIGADFGLATVTGNLLFDLGSTLRADLGGVTPGTEHDKLDVDGDLALGGTLDVSQIGTFSVGAGESFQIVEVLGGGALTGSFDNVVGLEANDDFVLDLTQSATGVSLVSQAVTNLAGVDSLTGTAGFEVFLGKGDDDTIESGGGAYLMHGGDGDDVFVLADAGFGRLDGGNDFDLVDFFGDADASFDLTALRGDQLSNIERIDISGTDEAIGEISLVLDLDTVLSATGGTNSLTGTEHTLIIDGDANDTLDLDAGWTETDTTSIPEINGYSIYENGDAKVFVDGAVAVTVA